MDPIFLLVLLDFAATLDQPSRGHVEVIVQRLDLDLRDAKGRAHRAAQVALSLTPSVALPAIHALAGLPDDATDEEVVGAVEMAFTTVTAMEVVHKAVRDALGGAEGDLIEIAKEAMRQNGELIQDRDGWRTLAQDNADAAATRNALDTMLTEVRNVLPAGDLGLPLVPEIEGLVGESRAHAREIHEIGATIGAVLDRPLIDQVIDLIAERDRLRVANEAKAVPAATIVIEDFEPIAPAPVQTSAPGTPPASKESGEGTMAMVDERIRVEEADRATRVGALIEAVGDLPEALARSSRVQVGPLSEALLSLAKGEPGTARQHAGRILNEHSNATASVTLANWLNAHFRNLATLVKPEDQREYRARFTAAIAEGKRPKKVAA